MKELPVCIAGFLTFRCTERGCVDAELGRGSCTYRRRVEDSQFKSSYRFDLMLGC